MKKKCYSRCNSFHLNCFCQDFTGVPAVVDLACMRDAMNKLGSDADKINPLVFISFKFSSCWQSFLQCALSPLMVNVETTKTCFFQIFEVKVQPIFYSIFA